MRRTLPCWGTGLALALACGWALAAGDGTKPGGEPGLPDLAEYRTVETVITTRFSRAVAAPAAQPGYLGVHLAEDPHGRPVVADVAADFPAARAGLRRGDQLVVFAGQEVGSVPALRDLLATRGPGEAVRLAVVRQDKPLELTATLSSASRPLKTGVRRATLGVRVGEPKAGEGVVVEQVVPGSPADKARLKAGEVLLKMDGVALTGPDKLRDLLAEKKPDETVTLTLLLADKPVDLKITLAAEEAPAPTGRGVSWDTRGGSYWQKDVYRLAVVCIEYPDVKHNPKVGPKEWEEALFSRGTYTKTSPTGQPVYGSLNDYYQEQSYGSLRVEGKVFDPVEVSKKRTEYDQVGRFDLLTEALDKLLAREGDEALKDFDGLCFLYAGGAVPAARGSLYWPHRASVAHRGKRWGYFICPEGGSRMATVSVCCHEFGHLLGLPDLYARPENPGSEGLGLWCAMSNQVGNGRPQHFSAWCKEKLGWLKPAVIDPTVKQKVILGPVEDSPKECLKVLVRPDGSEYLLLENRRKKGFDQSLPAEGLLIWRVVNNRPSLEESHGVEGPAGPRVFMWAVPYPSPANDAFTPYTTPSSRAQLGGGLPVYITNIRQLPDGRVAFHLGYEYQ